MEEKILRELSEIKKFSLLASKNVLTFDDLVLLTGLSRSHLYRLTSSHQIPYYKKGKCCFFFINEVEAWLKENRVNTTQEAESGAIRYVLAKEAGL